MYSPTINPDIVQSLYRIAKTRAIPMTKLVNKILEEYISQNKTEAMIREVEKLNGEG